MLLKAFANGDDGLLIVVVEFIFITKFILRQGLKLFFLPIRLLRSEWSMTTKHHKVAEEKDCHHQFQKVLCIHSGKLLITNREKSCPDSKLKVMLSPDERLRKIYDAQRENLCPSCVYLCKTIRITMNRLLLLAILALLAFSCDKDDPIPAVNFDQDVLNYDSGPNDAPQLPRGLSYQAVRFSASDLQSSNHIGRGILGVDFWIRDIPNSINVIIHRVNPSNSQEPGAVLYEHTLNSNDLSSSSWINHDLTENLDVPSEGFWIILEVDAGNEDIRVTGCDPGPRHPNGDIFGLFGSGLPGWTTFFDYSGEQESINWNIRAILKT